MNPERVFISADHGLAIVYFLQSGVVPFLLYEGIEVVLLTDDELVDKINQRFKQPGLIIEGLQMKQARQYLENVSPTTQWWMNFLRRVGASNKINVQALDSHVRQVEMEAIGRRRSLMAFTKLAISALRRSRIIRQGLVKLQMHYTPPLPGLYGELFDRYQPSLVIASTPAWRIDRFLMRESIRRGIPTASVIVGWDNPSSYSLSGSKIDWITCWSEIQKEELINGSDWDPNRVNVAGIPSYDGYFERQWLVSKEEYYALHHLDPKRKLLSYACSFTTFSPSYQNIEALARLVNSDALIEPCQLLIRLHPNHFLDDPLFAGERERINKLAQDLPHVHVVEPVPLGGELGYYSGEDMPEKSSMMAYSDIFLTVYSTMVVECSIHETPIISVCFDVPGGWNKPNRFYLPLSQISGWPTHKRFIDSGAGRVAMDEVELCDLINLYLRSPQEDVEKQRQFIRDECTYTDASAGRRTAGFILSLLKTK
jgi:hypothetical protein